MAVSHAYSRIPEFVRPVRAAHEGPGLDVYEACLDGCFFVSHKFFRRYKALDRQMMWRGLEVLADGEDIASCNSQILQERYHFAELLAQAHHQARFRVDTRRLFFDMSPRS